MLRDGYNKCLKPSLKNLEEKLVDMCEEYKELPMPGRTHGQYAIPTTVGKELAVFANRIAKQLDDIKKIEIYGKLNGAIGNFSSFYAAYPEIDWENFSRKFVESFGLKYNAITTQIESHDSWVDLFNKIKHINSILIGTDQDMWGYISDEYFIQKPEKGDEGVAGSSTMPQKINPIKFENSEGNLGLSNAMLNYFSEKFPISRFQRDLSDSTVARSIGTALGYSLISYKNTLRGLKKCEPYREELHNELENHWEMLAEPIQQILRRDKVSGAYDILKSKTKGKKWSKNNVVNFVEEENLRIVS